jgi:hypothetical protein
MLLVDAAAFLVLMVLCFARETPLGRWLDAGLVQRPARWLGGSGGDSGFAPVVWCWWSGAGLAGAGEGAVVALMGAPDLAVWFTTFEVSTWADALAAVAVGAFAFRVRMVVAWMRARWGRRRA